MTPKNIFKKNSTFEYVSSILLENETYDNHQVTNRPQLGTVWYYRPCSLKDHWNFAQLREAFGLLAHGGQENKEANNGRLSPVNRKKNTQETEFYHDFPEIF